MLRFLSLLFLVISGLLACTAVKPYVAPRITVAVDDQMAFAAVYANAVAQGWTIVRADAGRGRLEAVSPLTDTHGYRERQRWVFAVDDHEIRVRLTWEVQFEPDAAWRSHKDVCRSYVYAREKEQLAKILKLLPRVRVAHLPN
jgi:hypothetical protein